jgi:hypothetical protein
MSAEEAVEFSDFSVKWPRTECSKPLPRVVPRVAHSWRSSRNCVIIHPLHLELETALEPFLSHPPCGFLRPLLEWASRRGPYALLDLSVMFNEVLEPTS